MNIHTNQGFDANAFIQKSFTCMYNSILSERMNSTIKKWKHQVLVSIRTSKCFLCIPHSYCVTMESHTTIVLVAIFVSSAYYQGPGVPRSTLHLPSSVTGGWTFRLYYKASKLLLSSWIVCSFTYACHLVYCWNWMYVFVKHSVVNPVLWVPISFSPFNVSTVWDH